MNRISGHVGQGAGGLGLDSLQIAAHHPVLVDQQAVLVAQIENRNGPFEAIPKPTRTLNPKS
jgi:hypothetical protein